MKEEKKLNRTIGSAILLFALASTAAFVFSEENIFRPPSSRSRSSTGIKETERRIEARYGDSEEQVAAGRLQAKELLYILK